MYSFDMGRGRYIYILYDVFTLLPDGMRFTCARHAAQGTLNLFGNKIIIVIESSLYGGDMPSSLNIIIINILCNSYIYIFGILSVLPLSASI